MKQLAIVYLTLNDFNLDHYRAAEIYADVIVIDSGSSPVQKKLYSKFGVEWYENIVRPWDAGAQRNYAAKLLSKKYKYILFLDADEKITSMLMDELFAIMNLEEIKAVSIPSIYVLNKPLFYTCRDTYHDRFIATSILMNGTEVWTSSPGEVFNVQRSGVHKTKNGYLHFMTENGFINWLWRVIRYQYVNGQNDHFSRRIYKDFSWLRRNKIYTYPFFPVFYMLYFLVKRRCFLDGVNGLAFAFLVSLAHFSYPCGYLSMLFRKRAK